MEERIKVITAFGNQQLQDHLRQNMHDVEFVYEDLQYQDALLNVIKNECQVDTLILNMSLDGSYDSRTLIQSIRIIKKGINIVPLFKSAPGEDMQAWLETMGIHFVLIDNGFTIEDIYQSLKPGRKLQVIEDQHNSFGREILETEKGHGLLSKIYNSITHRRDPHLGSAPDVHRMKNTITLALFGSHPGAGCTHTAISIAWFLSVHGNSHVAVVELNGSGAFERLGRSMRHINEKYFEFNSLHFYHKSPVSSLINLRTYRYILIDCGCVCSRNDTGEIGFISNNNQRTFYSDRLSEIERADMKICVCQTKPWQADETFFLMDTGPGYQNAGDCLFYFTMTDDMTFSDIRRKYPGNKLYKAAYDPEIFIDNPERDKTFLSMLNRLIAA